MPPRQISTGQRRLDVCKSIYLFKHTPSHTLSTISTITQMSLKHPVFQGQMSSKKNAEKSRELALRRDTTLSLSQRKNRLRCRPPAALRGFRIQMTVQNLFTTISSKTCTEHVHNLSPAVPSMLCPLWTFLSFFLSWVSKTQPNHWTTRMVSTRLVCVALYY